MCQWRSLPLTRVTRIRYHIATIALSLALPVVGQAQESTRPAFPRPDSLAAISARGRLLAEYDFAAWHASDAVLSFRPSPGEVHGYVASRTDTGWVVVFGRLREDSTAFRVAYEARQSNLRPDSFTVERYQPGRLDSSHFARAARALGTARTDFGAVNRPYNGAVLPAEAGEWWVYLVPAQTVAGVFPLGGDVRYRVSADGRRITARRQLHRTIVEFRGPSDSVSTKAGFSAAILDNVPEDTDVFHVLVRQPRVPQYIVTDAFVYRIDPDGVIHLLGRRADVLGR